MQALIEKDSNCVSPKVIVFRRRLEPQVAASDIPARVRHLEKDQGAIEHRLEKLDDKLVEIGKGIAAIEEAIKPRTQPWWIDKLLPSLAVAAIVALVGVVIRMEFYQLPTLANNIEGVVKSMGELQRLQATTSLSSAEQEVKAGQILTANTYVEQATNLIQKAQIAHAPAPASFFQNTFDTIVSLSKSGVDQSNVHHALLQLASYRSAMQIEPPAIRTAQWRVISSPLSTNQIAEQLAGCGKTPLDVSVLRDLRQLRCCSTASVAFGMRSPVLPHRRRWMSLGTGPTDGYGIGPSRHEPARSASSRRLEIRGQHVVQPTLLCC